MCYTVLHAINTFHLCRVMVLTWKCEGIPLAPASSDVLPQWKLIISRVFIQFESSRCYKWVCVTSFHELTLKQKSEHKCAPPKYDVVKLHARWAAWWHLIGQRDGHLYFHPIMLACCEQLGWLKTNKPEFNIMSLNFLQNTKHCYTFIELGVKTRRVGNRLRNFEIPKFDSHYIPWVFSKEDN